VPVVCERGDEVIRLPDNIVSTAVDDTDFIHEIFPHLHEQFADKKFLTERAILTSRIRMSNALTRRFWICVLASKRFGKL